MRINDVEVERPAVALRAFLGDRRVDELNCDAVMRARFLSVEEVLVLAEFFRLIAEARARAEGENAIVTHPTKFGEVSDINGTTGDNVGYE
jgi:hypothetical protein